MESHQIAAGAAQSKPESWSEIAREAWDGIARYYGIQVADGTGIEHILASIERSHAAQPQWTAETVYDMLTEAFNSEMRGGKLIAECHNAALAAAVFKAALEEIRWWGDKLADERQRREQAEQQILNREQRWEELEQIYKLNLGQLLAAQAAIERAITYDQPPTLCAERLDLSVLHQHDAEVRKPLVDELQNIIDCDLAGMRKDFGNDTDRQFRIWAQNRARHPLDALAKVKE